MLTTVREARMIARIYQTIFHYFLYVRELFDK